MLLLQVLSSGASGSSTDSLGHGAQFPSLPSSSSPSSPDSCSPLTTPFTELSSNASETDDPFTLSSVTIPAPPPSLSSSDGQLPVSSPSATTTSEVSSASMSDATWSPISPTDSPTQLLSSVSSGRDRTTTKISESERITMIRVISQKLEKADKLWGGIEDGVMEVLERFGESSLAAGAIARVEVIVQKSEQAKELLDSIMEDAERLGESSLAGQIMKIRRKALLAEVKLRRMKTLVKREARANGETRTARDMVAADRHLVDSGRRLALGGRHDEVDDGRARADRTSEWLKGLPCFD